MWNELVSGELRGQPLAFEGTPEGDSRVVAELHPSVLTFSAIWKTGDVFLVTAQVLDERFFVVSAAFTLDTTSPVSFVSLGADTVFRTMSYPSAACLGETCAVLWIASETDDAAQLVAWVGR